MDVFYFKSDCGNIEITAATVADMPADRRRFRSRVKGKASTYCDYRSTLSGLLRLASAPDFSLSDNGEESATEWTGLPPVFSRVLSPPLNTILIHLKVYRIACHNADPVACQNAAL